MTIPSREDSLERLAEQEVQFAEEAESVEETVLRKLRYAQLHKALSLLSNDERELIDRLFFLTWGMTVQAFFALVHFHSPYIILHFGMGYENEIQFYTLVVFYFCFICNEIFNINLSGFCSEK